ncbi:MAG: hypothetical protein LIP11_06230 [Clostridiales bacterium]|nr:hypothetical protein [Clostridiales bacterium]
MDISKQVTRLKKFLDESRYTVAITGAGISFSAGGMNFDHENVEELLPLASVDVLRNEPDRYYRLLDHAFLHSMFAKYHFELGAGKDNFEWM